MKIENKVELYQQEYKDLSKNATFLTKYIDKEFRDNTKGRKRVNVLIARNPQQLLDEIIKPLWQETIKKFSQRERQHGILRRARGNSEFLGYNEYAWTQLLKDIQKFLRLIFKKRFHRLDKRNDSKRGQLVKSILKELGISHEGTCEKAFHYFYPVLTKLRKVQ